MKTNNKNVEPNKGTSSVNQRNVTYVQLGMTLASFRFIRYLTCEGLTVSVSVRNLFLAVLCLRISH